MTERHQVFLKGQIPRFSPIVIFSVKDFLSNAMSESAETGMVGLHIPH